MAKVRQEGSRPSNWTSVNRFGEILEWLERDFVENVGHDHVSADGQVRFPVVASPHRPLPPFLYIPMCTMAFGGRPRNLAIFPYIEAYTKNTRG